MIVYLDETLIKRSKVNEIFKFFDITLDQVILRKDPHYRV